MCSKFVRDDEPMTRQRVHHVHGRIRWAAWEPVCLPCIPRDDDGRILGYVQHLGGRRQVYVDSRAVDVDPQPCISCGLPVMVAPDKRRKMVTCSDACRRRYYSSRVERVTPVQHVCDGCGQTMTGRADRRYCSAACRQRAYRDRTRVTD